MKFYTLIAIIAISFIFNGCLAVDRIKQRLFPEKRHKVARQVSSNKQVSSNQTEKVQPVKKEAVEVKKTYTPSKPTAAIYTESEPKKIKKVKSSNKPHKKRKAHKKKVHKIKPEPYSIGKNEEDPELLGPQTTIESNPLTKNSKKEDKKSKI